MQNKAVRRVWSGSIFGGPPNSAAPWAGSRALKVSANPVPKPTLRRERAWESEDVARRARASGGEGDAVVGGPQTWQEAAHRAPRGWGIWSQHPQPAGTERPAPGPGPRRPLGEATRCSSKPPLRPWGCGGGGPEMESPGPSGLLRPRCRGRSNPRSPGTVTVFQTRSLLCRWVLVRLHASQLKLIQRELHGLQGTWRFTQRQGLLSAYPTFSFIRGGDGRGLPEARAPRTCVHLDKPGSRASHTPMMSDGT